MTSPTQGLNGVMNYVWVRFLAIIATILIPFLLTAILWLAQQSYNYFANGFERIEAKITTLATNINEHQLNEAQAVSNLSGRLSVLEDFARDGGRYTQDEADRDWARQHLINEKQTELVERLTERLEELGKWQQPTKR